MTGPHPDDEIRALRRRVSDLKAEMFRLHVSDARRALRRALVALEGSSRDDEATGDVRAALAMLRGVD